MKEEGIIVRMFIFATEFSKRSYDGSYASILVLDKDINSRILYNISND